MATNLKSRAETQADRLVSVLPEHGLAVLNGSQTIVGWNAVLPSLLGCDEANLRAAPLLYDLFDPQQLSHPLTRLLNGEIRCIEWERGPDIPIVAVRADALPDGGRVVFFYELEPNGPDQRRAHLARLLEGLEKIDQGFALFDPQDSLVLSNSVFDRLILGEAQALPGRSFSELIRLFAITQMHFPDPTARDGWVRERVGEHAAPGRHREFDLSDGRRVRLHEILTEDGGTVTLLADVTEQRAEETRRELADRSGLLQSTLDMLEEGLAIFDADFRLTVWNRRYLQLMRIPESLAKVGITLDRLVLEHAKMGMYGPGRPEDQARDRLSIIKSGESYCFERRHLDGTTLCIRGEPLPDGGCMCVFTDISQARAHEDKVTYLATHDALTTLPNRHVFTSRLETAIKARGSRGVALLFLDLLNFKDLNATLGHDFGDMILRATAQRIKNTATGRPFIARFGGDKFAVILEFLDGRDKARQLARQLMDAFDTPVVIEGDDLHLSVSIGVAYAPSDAETPEKLISRAELALFAAKDDQANKIQEFHPRLTAAAESRRELQQDLRRALKQNQLELHFQPKINALRNCVTGLEALIRWKHPERGYVPPGEFIPIAEHTGLILPIGEWVMEEACRVHMQLIKDGFGAIDMAVNLSATQLHHTGLVQSIRRILKQSGMSPPNLELEITESAAMRDAEGTRTVLGALADLGVKLTIDDFGTGYSSLSYLKRFPVSKIKIDRSFVQGVCHDVDDEAIVNAVIQLAASLGLNVIAEAVETEEQLHYLTSHDCPEIQGFFFSPPLPLRQLTRFLERWQTHPVGRAVPAE